ncbi:MAG: NAD(P)-dependent alcohol dehydrogenase [Rhodococcus sp. (in: high G+C Gram-positive bacteria)]|nr:MAG: NAD(P)-dependent alcohol dehydrogenase [Rhodococcus sp. (in: high G+C Gram-positive bacteria)]
MVMTKARMTSGPGEPFVPTLIERRDVGPTDVLIEIAYAGLCHTDVSQARSELGPAHYPLVPGHEIAGVVSAIGAEVRKVSVGNRVGVGCLVDSCRECLNCLSGQEQECTGRLVKTTNSIGPDGQPAHGGYSERIVVNQDFVLQIPDTIPLEQAAPLLCAGVTVYAPLCRWKAGPGTRVAIVGFGGLGHLALKIAKAFGAQVSVLDLSEDKHDDAMRLGADEFFASTFPGPLAERPAGLDLIITTAPPPASLDPWLEVLGVNGTLVNLSASTRPLTFSPGSLMAGRRTITSSRIGGIAETQEMLDFCGEHGIGAEVEVVSADRIDEAFERMLAGDVKFRFVLDNATL